MKAIVALLMLATPAVAGHCVQRQVVHYNYAQPVVLQTVAYPYAYYSVGAAVQEEAVAERIARLVDQKVAKRLKLAERAEQPQGAALLTQKCSACHKAGSKAVVDSAAPILFGPEGEWTGNDKQASVAVSAVKHGNMPPAPAEPLDDDSFLAIKSSLLSK